MKNIKDAIEDMKKAIRLSKIDNKINNNYRIAAKEIGWEDGHTPLYENTLMIWEAKEGLHR